VFKAMKPVFNQFASELQRSLNYFTGTDRSAKIGKVLLLGNAAKLRGLSDFVAKQLQLDVQRFDHFAALEGPATSSPVFRDNRLSFGTAYGLSLQAANAAGLRTNLLPREIARDRLIAAKRPWAVAAMLALLAAGLANFSGWFASAATYEPSAYRNAFAASDNAKSRSAAAKAAVEEAEQRVALPASGVRDDERAEVPLRGRLGGRVESVGPHEGLGSVDRVQELGDAEVTRVPGPVKRGQREVVLQRVRQHVLAREPDLEPPVPEMRGAVVGEEQHVRTGVRRHELDVESAAQRRHPRHAGRVRAFPGVRDGDAQRRPRRAARRRHHSGPPE
jgi:hypothetical protein